MDQIDCPQCIENLPRGLGCTDCQLTPEDIRGERGVERFESDCNRCRWLVPVGFGLCSDCKVELLTERNRELEAIVAQLQGAAVAHG